MTQAVRNSRSASGSVTMNKDLDCSYKLPWDIQTYHEVQAFAFNFGVRWCYMRGNTVYSLRLSNFSMSLRDDVAKRFRRWLKYMREKK